MTTILIVVYIIASYIISIYMIKNELKENWRHINDDAVSKSLLGFIWLFSPMLVT